MRRVSGTLDGTGSAIYLGLGFIPDAVEMFNLESTNPYFLKWNKDMRSAGQIGGYVIDNATPARLAETAGIELYEGGDIAASGNTAYLVPFDMVHGQYNLARKGELITTAVTSWTLDTAASRTGSFNAGVNTSHVGIGSKVRIWNPLTRKEYEATIMVLTNDGDADDEVEFDIEVPSGDVMFIGPRFDYVAAPAGMVIPQGLKIATTGNLNSSGETIQFEACEYLR